MGTLRNLIFLAAAAALPIGCARAAASPPIALTNDAGSAWTLSGQRGKAVLLTFGFTHCADTCPATLAKLERVSNEIDPNGRRVEIAFVTVDPQRDTARALHEWLDRFETDRIVGLTGSPARIAGVLSAYHIWAQPIPNDRGKRGYDMAHSTAIYFIDPSGRTRSIHDDADSDAVISKAVSELLD